MLRSPTNELGFGHSGCTHRAPSPLGQNNPYGWPQCGSAVSNSQPLGVNRGLSPTELPLGVRLLNTLS